MLFLSWVRHTIISSNSVCCLVTRSAEVLNEYFMTNVINQVENMSAGDSRYGGSLKDRSVKASPPDSYADGLNAVT